MTIPLGCYQYLDEHLPTKQEEIHAFSLEIIYWEGTWYRRRVTKQRVPMRALQTSRKQLPARDNNYIRIHALQASDFDEDWTECISIEDLEEHHFDLSFQNYDQD